MRFYVFALIPLAALVVILLLVTRHSSLATGFRPDPGRPAVISGVPSGWLVTDGQIEVLDEAGRALWRTHLPIRLDPTPFASTMTNGYYITLVDLDGDGRHELLFIGWEAVGRARTLYCFNGDGTLRFEHEQQHAARVGGVDHTPPLTAARFWLTGDPGGRHTIWFASNHVLGPSMLEKLDPSGKVLGQYWHYGHVDAVQDALAGNRRIVLVGATNNESHGSSLAVLDYDNPTATAPAKTAQFRCTNCPGGAPLQFFVFPQDDVSRVGGSGRTTVDMFVVNALAHHVIARVSSGGTIGTDTQPTEWSIFYTFDDAFDLTKVEFTEVYRTAHARLRGLGALDHELGDRDLREASRVQRWDGRGFVATAPATSSTEK